MRGSLKLRKSSWVIVVDVGTTVDPATGGTKRKQKFMRLRAKRPGRSGGYTRDEAQKKLTAMLSSLDRGEFVEPSKLTLAAWLTRWIDAVKDSHARPTTHARYASVVARVRASAIAGVPLQRLLPSAIGSYYATLAKTLAPSTVQLHHAVLHRALQTAVKDRLLSRNPAADVDSRPTSAKDKSAHARAGAWTADEARTFLATADAAGPQTSAFYALALDTGARLRELCGLTWADVNLDTGLVTIRRQLDATLGAAPTWGPTKTGRAREVLLTPETVQRLVAHRKAQAEIKMRHRLRYQDFGLVFAKEHLHVRRGKDSLGQPLGANHVSSREFAGLCTAAGVRRIRFHDLRHSHATLALAHGEPVQDVSARLGHAKVSMTLDIYAHATDRKAPTTIRRVLFGA